MIALDLKRTLALFFLLLLLGSHACAETLYTLKKGDYLGKIVSENYPSKNRKTSRDQIMIAILRANPSAFRGGNVHFLKSVKTLKLPSEDIIATIPKSEASTQVQQHFISFQNKETGNYPVIPLEPDVLSTEAETTSTARNSSQTENIAESKITPGQKLPTASQQENDTDQSEPSSDSSKQQIVTEQGDAESPPQTADQTDTAHQEKTPVQESAEGDKQKQEMVSQTPSSQLDADRASEKHNQSSSANTEFVRVYNWSDYIPEGVLENFTRETGVRVEYSTFDNNEIMYQKVKLFKGRGYDVLIPSTYLVQRMRDEGLIQNIDHEQLKNLKNLDPVLMNQDYDPDNAFSIPYLWGTTGIIINKALSGDIDIESWKDLWDRKLRGKLVLVDDVRDVFHMALKINGHSINTTNSDEIKQAYDRLQKLMPNVKSFSDNPLKELLAQKAAFGTIWNGEAVIAQEKSKSYQYIYPKEGASFWIDSFVIASQSKNVENAHLFIDYMLRPEIAKQCVKELGYATPNLKALKLLDENTRNNTAIFPEKSIFEKAEFQKDIGKAMELYLFYWEKLKGGGGI